MHKPVDMVGIVPAAAQLPAPVPVAHAAAVTLPLDVLPADVALQLPRVDRSTRPKSGP